MASDEKILEVLEMLCEYYEKEPTDNALRIYRAAFGEQLAPDITDETLEMAAYDWIARSKWFPKVAELREAAQRVRQMGVQAAYNTDPDGRQHNRTLYWLAMEAFNSNVRLDNDKAWLAFERQSVHPPACPCRICAGADEQEIWQQACADAGEASADANL